MAGKVFNNKNNGATSRGVMIKELLAGMFNEHFAMALIVGELYGGGCKSVISEEK
jgi:hypothetical protein